MPKRTNDPLVKPFLKWAGGKRQLLPELKKHLPEDFDRLRYFEPFVGAAALLLDCQPKRAVINDNNADLMLTYEIIRDNVNEIINALNAHRVNNNKEYYYRVRSQDRNHKAFAAMTEIERASRLIYLNKTCFNGLYRVNAQGLFNVPYGRYTNPAICDEPVLRAIHRYFNHADTEVDILNVDFASAVRNARQGSFIYFDPPYHSPDNNNFTGYQANGFGDAEQKRLRDVFIRRTEAGAKCLLSNSDTQLIRELYNDDRFEIISVKAKRAINSNGAGRGEVDEVLIRNWR